MIAILDNYDSFVFNLAQAFGSMGEDVRVIRSDAIDVAGLKALRPDAIVLSPGPGRPEDAGVSLRAITELSERIPMLGVCLGHQAIAAAFGARVIRAPQPLHGKASQVHHGGTGLFAGLSSPFEAGRYHSLVADAATLPDCLLVTARTADEIVMAVRHRERALFGVQFHPESVLTPQGGTLLRNFLNIARGSHAKLSASRSEV